jgi:hypothetical protein
VLSTWQPISGIPINVPVNPGMTTYAPALLLAIFSGFLFGLVPRQELRADPWQIIRSSSSGGGRMLRLSLREALLGLQIAICAVLATGSLVAVRGLARSMESNYGFQPQNAVLVHSDLHMGGYDGEQQPQMQRRMLEAAAAIPGVTAAGYVDRLSLSMGGSDSSVFADSTTVYRPECHRQCADARCLHWATSARPGPRCGRDEASRWTTTRRPPWWLS